MNVGGLPLCVFACMCIFRRKLAEDGEDIKEHAAGIEGLDDVFVEMAGPVLLVGPTEKLHGVVFNVCRGYDLKEFIFHLI